ncbi:GDSL-type esterase/lipase family protein, partial [Corynebacterium heidelbergense]
AIAAPVGSSNAAAPEVPKDPNNPMDFPPTGPNVVVLGDSFMANPDLIYDLGKYVWPGIVPTSLPRQDGCLQTDDNAARQLAALTQRRVDDWSCPGQTSVALVERTRTAIAKKYLGPATTSVVIGIGGNDSGPLAAQQGIDVNNPQAVHDALTTNMRLVASDIHGAAPNAKIIMVGLPEISAGPNICVINVVPGAPGAVPFGVSDFEQRVRTNQRDAAAAVGATFVDVHEQTRGHNTCAPDDQRYVAGIIDTTSPKYHFVVHPTVLGSRAIAEGAANALA